MILPSLQTTPCIKWYLSQKSRLYFLSSKMSWTTIVRLNAYVYIYFVALQYKNQSLITWFTTHYSITQTNSTTILARIVSKPKRKKIDNRFFFLSRFSFAKHIYVSTSTYAHAHAHTTQIETDFLTKPKTCINVLKHALKMLTSPNT